jgi:hypothetical protein
MVGQDFIFFTGGGMSRNKFRFWVWDLLFVTGTAADRSQQSLQRVSGTDGTVAAAAGKIERLPVGRDGVAEFALSQVDGG